MLDSTILNKKSRDEIEGGLKRMSPHDVEVANGKSPKCPVYVKQLPPCRHECPSSEDIRGYLQAIAHAEYYKKPQDESFDEAWYLLTDKNPMPAVHGRICPHPCEKGCNRKDKEDGAVAINNMERFIGDWGLSRGLKLRKLVDKPNGKKVAVVGSGPSGLSAAYQLARRGYAVTIFENFEKAGGMLRYGIPQYRLPDKVLDAEIQNILDLGVELKLKTRVGQDVSFEDLQKQFDAIYVAIGAHRGIGLGVKGEDSANVFTGASYLNRVKSGAQVEIGKRVVVIGGGDSAIDAARVSKRLLNTMKGDQAKTALDSARITKRLMESADVTILYRRTKAEMPAIAKDVDEAMAEGVKFEFLSAPVEFETDGGRAKAIKCIRMQLGAPDKSGRRKPEPMPGSEFTLGADTVISAVGQQPELVGGLAAIGNKSGWVDVDSNHRTKVDTVFAGGDVLGLGISTKSVGQGRKAAESIDALLRGADLPKEVRIKPVKTNSMRLDYYLPVKRAEEKALPPEDRIHGFHEIHQTITKEEAVTEAARCMSCGLCFMCDQCRVFCPYGAIERDRKKAPGYVMFTDYTKCVGCQICHEACPCGYIHMGLGHRL